MARSIGERLRAKFSRRHSTASTISHSSADGEAQAAATPSPAPSRTLQSHASRGSQRPSSTIDSATIEEEGKDVAARGVHVHSVDAGEATRADERDASGDPKTLEYQPSNDLHETAAPSSKLLEAGIDDKPKHDSISTVDFSTPSTDILPVPEEDEDEHLAEERGEKIASIQFDTPTYGPANPNNSKPDLPRRQSLLPAQQTKLIKTLLETDLPSEARAASLDYFTNNGPSTISPNMVSRKIWVKRPGASATLVTINEDDLVDDVRDMILKKYANSLGRSFDSPDVTLRIVPREQRQERTLGPEEPMSRTLDAYFPGGQTVEEALVIDVPLRRTPKPSPQPQNRYYDEQRPMETGSDYFPPMPVPAAAQSSPHLPTVLPAGVNGNPHTTLTAHSMSVLTTGHVPALPSPGSTTRRHHRERPRIGRQHTSSPTVLNGSVSQPAVNNEHSSAPPAAPPLPTPPAPQAQNHDLASQIQRVATPPPRISSPRPRNNRPKKSKKANGDHPSLPAGMLNGAVPPINVLIVEDNIINLKLLEAFMKRLKVRWQTAMNGREAVTKWRAGGFHLVLMDIQLPIMSGLEATKEIRRLERLNSIGVFSSSASSSAPEQGPDEPSGEDKLPSSVLFKSPVIIVALTASSLQSDRHEALAAGCNDFLTKPVNFVWLERKVMEWGCMQALIDFDGWRKWKDFSQNNTETEKEKSGKAIVAAKKKKNRASLGSNPGGSTSRLAVHEEGPETVAVS
ncbi:related to response regulator Mcs4 [Phialocephala subalpina]|uniref:Related to response regulator Mcs4 n=1 Tax=Phialocephala subalpina TaxID=576137 RepID=A0A1L7XF82_9HELO|nr:related to response regulator Mcs4 [Phialocephala subalpina]